MNKNNAQAIAIGIDVPKRKLDLALLREGPADPQKRRGLVSFSSGSGAPLLRWAEPGVGHHNKLENEPWR